MSQSHLPLWAFLGLAQPCPADLSLLTRESGMASWSVGGPSVPVAMLSSPPGCGPGLTGPSLPTGDLLIIMAQIIVAIQMVLEEKFVYKHNVHPLRAVGTEGMCGPRAWEEGNM